jgi:maltose O-acetyltransferase
VTTELEKMLAGELYDPADPVLVRMREQARALCWALNETKETEQAKRRGLLQQLLGSGADSAWIQPPFFCDYGSNIKLGQRVYFNFNCVVLDVCEVRIGEFTMFGPAVQLYTAMHPLSAAERRKKEYSKPIEIGADCWIGGGAIICPGVKIGAKTVIGAGSVVTRDIPSGVLAVGNPCRVLREIRDDE